MTTAKRKKEPYYSAMPSVNSLLNPILHALRERGGNGPTDKVTSEVENKFLQDAMVNRFPSARLEIHSRLNRALELLSKTGLVCRKGLYSLKLTPKALVVPESAIENLSEETLRKKHSVDIVVESEKTLPLPDEISSDILEFLSEKPKMSALEIEERVLQRYAYDQGILEAEELEQVSRRALTARRILESKHLITHDSDGMFRLTDRGRSVNPVQAQRIARLSIGTYLRHQLLKLRLFMEEQAQIETRRHIFEGISAFLLGVGRYFTRPKRREPQVELVREKQATYSD